MRVARVEREMTSRTETDVVEDLVRQYLREIGAYELLSAAEEAALGRVMETAGEAEMV